MRSLSTLVHLLFTIVQSMQRFLVVGQATESVTRRLTEKLLREEYDRRIRPLAEDAPLSVNISIHVKSLRAVSEVTMDYQLEIYFSEQWCDSRLSYKPSEFGGRNVLQLHETIVDAIWSPDTFFPNAIESKNPDPKSVTHRGLLRLTADGCLLHSRRLSVTAECPMDLRLYPFDTQVCRLSVESFGSTTDQVVYGWNQSAVMLAESLELPMFQVTRVITKQGVVATELGSYSRLECCFILHRLCGMFYFQIFLPAAGIVVMAWFVLWMKGFTQFSDMIAVILATILQYFMYHQIMPKVSYLKALDVYMAVCFAFVFGALIKHCTFTVFCEVSKTDTYIAVPYSSEHDSATTHRIKVVKKIPMLYTEKYWNIFNFIYIVLFCVFCVIYFGILLTVHPAMFQKHATCNVGE